VAPPAAVDRSLLELVEAELVLGRFMEEVGKALVPDGSELDGWPERGQVLSFSLGLVHADEWKKVLLCRIHPITAIMPVHCLMISEALYLSIPIHTYPYLSEYRNLSAYLQSLFHHW
jgi:hypothetical protein